MATTAHTPAARAALTALILVQAVMLASLMAGLEPHPPRAIALFAMGPFLASALATAAAALMMGATAGRAGRVLSLIAALQAMLSFGPQKWLDPNIAEIWPAVLTAEVAAVVLAVACLRGSRRRTTDPA